MTGVVFDDFGDDVAQVIDQLGDGPAVVLGHAFGNFVARNLASVAGLSPYPLACRGGAAAAVEARRPDQLFRRELG